jgi:3-deoxy-D-manno-octulosonic-acid transferase
MTSAPGTVGRLTLTLYGGLGRLAEPVLGLVLDQRARRGKESGERRGERLGVASAARPDGPLIWIHAASIGETMSVLPLVSRLIEQGLGVLLTTGTVTSAEIAERRLAGGAIHQYVPIDTPGAVKRFLDHWRPDLALFTESELWPTLLASLRQRGVRLLLVNGRLSQRSARRWGRAPIAARTVLSLVDLVLAQTTVDAERFRALGAPHVAVCGNLKFDVPAPPADPAELEALREGLAGRAVFLAASTHPGEEAVVLEAHALLRKQTPNLLTMIAPRHPARGPEVQSAAAQAGRASALRSQGEAIHNATEIYVADTIGEMGLWYRLAGATFLGGSIVPHGGQNPIEPAKLGVPILHGPDVSNFTEVYRALAEVGSVGEVTDAAGLASAVLRILTNHEAAERTACEARACVERLAGAVDRTLAALEPDLKAMRARGDAAHRA